MAYSEKQLTTQWMPQVRWSDGNNVNLITVREAIQNQADENGIPVAFSEDQMETSQLEVWAGVYLILLVDTKLSLKLRKTITPFFAIVWRM